ncbi:MAG TPA: DNA polymerase III subunit gamma/tau [Roseiarcus sp.]|nr:DNA polymerase III subunit gamma/tau [Roseiarcus sp.]
MADTNSDAPAYRVLARKYRPATFDDLIGQEAMVRTLANAFALGRIHQAYILTGVRGVGKTTTARILARAFNYEAPGFDKPSIAMPELGVHCQAIMESRHVDVIEMDAASHTGIDDVREIIENARYRPVSARTKVYIIDEVHMLSKAAFNGLLKTLEEPPEHVKFLFATTEIEKVPVTVRSRCIRFDLKRIETERLVAHLDNICKLENVRAEPDALALIARLAEGSVRDCLSLLDQAIAHGGPAGVGAADLRGMLGLSDRGDVVELFRLAMRGEIAEALEMTQRLYRAGADPAEMLLELSEFCHFVTRAKISAAALSDAAVSEAERAAAGEIANSLTMGALGRAWTLIMNGYADVKDSPRPLASLDMAIVRLAYGADLPGPEEALRKLSEGGALAAPRLAPPPSPPAAPRASVALAPAPIAAAAPRLARFEDLVALARDRRDIALLRALEHDMRIVRFEPGRIEFTPTATASPTLANGLAKKLGDWTGERWMISIAQGATAPTLGEKRQAKEDEKRAGVAAHPVVRKVMELFPGAKIVAVRAPQIQPPEAPPPETPPADEDVGYSEPPDFDED